MKRVEDVKSMFNVYNLLNRFIQNILYIIIKVIT